MMLDHAWPTHIGALPWPLRRDKRDLNFTGEGGLDGFFVSVQHLISTSRTTAILPELFQNVRAAEWLHKAMHTKLPSNTVLTLISSPPTPDLAPGLIGSWGMRRGSGRVSSHISEMDALMADLTPSSWQLPSLPAHAQQQGQQEQEGHARLGVGGQGSALVAFLHTQPTLLGLQLPGHPTPSQQQQCGGEHMRLEVDCGHAELAARLPGLASPVLPRVHRSAAATDQQQVAQQGTVEQEQLGVFYSHGQLHALAAEPILPTVPPAPRQWPWPQRQQQQEQGGSDEQLGGGCGGGAELAELIAGLAVDAPVLPGSAVVVARQAQQEQEGDLGEGQPAGEEDRAAWLQPAAGVNAEPVSPLSHHSALVQQEGDEQQRPVAGPGCLAQTPESGWPRTPDLTPAPPPQQQEQQQPLPEWWQPAAKRLRAAAAAAGPSSLHQQQQQQQRGGTKRKAGEASPAAVSNASAVQPAAPLLVGPPLQVVCHRMF